LSVAIGNHEGTCSPRQTTLLDILVAMTSPQSAKNESAEACPSTDSAGSSPSDIPRQVNVIKASGLSYSFCSPVEYKGEFDWSPQTQGFVLGSFFYGYLLTQIIGGKDSLDRNAFPYLSMCIFARFRFLGRALRWQMDLRWRHIHRWDLNTPDTTCRSISCWPTYRHSIAHRCF
jgi:hypothetical protein